MDMITAADANRQFSTLLRRVAQGETLTVTSRGKPVAMISPVAPAAADPLRQQAQERLLRHLQSVRPSGDVRDWTRDDLYD